MILPTTINTNVADVSAATAKRISWKVIMGRLLKHTPPNAGGRYMAARRRRLCAVAPIDCLKRPRGDSARGVTADAGPKPDLLGGNPEFSKRLG
jgi:hypothetical protein